MLRRRAGPDEAESAAECRSHERFDLAATWAGTHLRAMIQTRIVGELEQRSHAARLLIRRPVHDELDAGLLRRACAHRTRLDRDVQGTAGQPPPPERPRRLAQGENL